MIEVSTLYFMLSMGFLKSL